MDGCQKAAMDVCPASAALALADKAGFDDLRGLSQLPRERLLTRIELGADAEDQKVPEALV